MFRLCGREERGGRGTERWKINTALWQKTSTWNTDEMKCEG